jgi:hypothetical protein
MTTNNSTPAVESGHDAEEQATAIVAPVSDRAVQDAAAYAAEAAAAEAAPVSAALDALHVARSGNGVNDHIVYQRQINGVECALANDGRLHVLGHVDKDGYHGGSDSAPVETVALLEFFRPIVLAEQERAQEQQRPELAPAEKRDLDSMSLDEIATLASAITRAILVTGHIEWVRQAAEGLMRSAGELGALPGNTKARQAAHLLELMAILRTPDVLPAATRDIADRLSRDIDIGAMLREDEHVLVSLLPAIVDVDPDQLAASVRRVMRQGAPASRLTSNGYT